MLDLVVRGGQVVTPHGVGAWDIAIEGEKIVAVAVPGALRDAKPARIIDASGKIVVPGGVDAHIHCKWPTRQAGAFSAPPAPVSRAALFGGTTTLLDFAVWNRGQTLQQAIELRDADWMGQCCCDYAYHLLVFASVNAQTLLARPGAGFFYLARRD